MTEDSYRLSPNNPLTYGLHAVVIMYSGDFTQAKANEAIALNPEIEFSRFILAFIEKQERNLPAIGPIIFPNL